MVGSFFILLLPSLHLLQLPGLNCREAFLVNSQWEKPISNWIIALGLLCNLLILGIMFANVNIRTFCQIAERHIGKSCISNYLDYFRPCKIWASYGGRCVERIQAPKSKYIDVLKSGSKNCLGPNFQPI